MIYDYNYLFVYMVNYMPIYYSNSSKKTQKNIKNIYLYVFFLVFR